MTCLYMYVTLQREEVLELFNYDKYLPANSTECKHALFMRLTR